MDYVVTVNIGPHEAPVWTMTSDSRDPDPDPAAGLWTLDGYRQSWDVPDGQWPAQPEPAVCSMTLGTTDQALLPPMEIGTPLSVTVTGWFGITQVGVASFYGRISDAQARTRGDGLEVAITGVDHYADLREDYVGVEPWPQEYPMDRLDRILAAVGEEWAVMPVFDTFDSFRPLDVDNRPAADVVEEHLAQLARTGGFIATRYFGWERGIVVFSISEGLWPEEDPVPAGTVQWQIQTLTERVGDRGPLVLGLGPDGITLVVQPLDSADRDATMVGHVSADYVDLDVAWRRDKARATNRVQVNGNFSGIFGEFGPDLTVTTDRATAQFADLVAERGPVTLTKDSTLAFVHSATAMAQMYLGAREDLAGRWAVEGFSVNLSDLPDAASARRFLPVFPSHLQAIPGNGGFFPPTVLLYPYGRVMAVTEVRPEQNPGNGRPWLAGQLVGAELEIRDGDIDVKCHLRPNVPRPAHLVGGGVTTGAPLSPAALLTIQAGAYATTAPADLDPTLTPYDLRLARSQ